MIGTNCDLRTRLKMVLLYFYHVGLICKHIKAVLLKGYEVYEEDEILTKKKYSHKDLALLKDLGLNLEWCERAEEKGKEMDLGSLHV